MEEFAEIVEALVAHRDSEPFERGESVFDPFDNFVDWFIPLGGPAHSEVYGTFPVYLSSALEGLALCIRR